MEFTTEQLDVTVALWERLCAVHFVRAETQGYYEHSTRNLWPGADSDQHRMPNADEIRALVLSDGEECEYPVGNPWSDGDRLYPITLSLMAYGDGYGTDYDAANVRALRETPGVTVSTPGRRDDGGSATVVVGDMSSFANAQGETPDPATAIEWLASLVSQMEHLTDYPLLDDDAHSEYVNELAGESWDAYLRSDVSSELGDLSPTGEFGYDDVRVAGDARTGEDIVREAYYAYEGNEWNATTATEVANGHHDDAVRHVAATVLGWDLDAIAAEREARTHAETVARATFDTAWADYRARYPLAMFDTDPERYGDAIYGAMQQWDDLLPATVDTVREAVIGLTQMAATFTKRP